MITRYRRAYSDHDRGRRPCKALLVFGGDESGKQECTFQCEKKWGHPGQHLANEEAQILPEAVHLPSYCITWRDALE